MKSNSIDSSRTDAEPAAKPGRSLHIGLYESRRFELDVASLTKHAIILGATGSGKTVLAKVIVEEAALLGIPTFAIDPKGDIGNLAFQSEDFDFSRWCGREADAQGADRRQYAVQLQKTYSDRAKEFGVTPMSASEFAKVTVRIFTPKSSAGLPVGISPDLAAPANFGQLLGSDFSAAADLLDLTSFNLLRLSGFGEDSRKEITFVSALLEHFWKAGQNLTIQELIRSIENPPIQSIGSMHVSDVLSDRERHNLATQINLLVSDPKLRSWSAASRLDFSSLFGGPPSVNVLDLRNIQSEQEKQLFVEIILQQLFQWLIKQGSAQTLRYLLYFDEIAGYCPPVREPPSKKLLLLLIKQARAFGLGLVLASQNAVDLDYKVISNANVRFIGRLGAQRDIQRVSIGLELDSFATKEISRLKAGEFFCNIFDPRFRGVVRARWPLTYHRGPLENSEISELVARHRFERNAQRNEEEAGTAPESQVHDLEAERAPQEAGSNDDWQADDSDPQPDMMHLAKRRAAKQEQAAHTEPHPEDDDLAFLQLAKKFQPDRIASFIKLGNNIKSVKVLSSEAEQAYHPIFAINVSVFEKKYCKQSLEKSAELCVLEEELVPLPAQDDYSVAPRRPVPDQFASDAARWQPEVTKAAEEIKRELRAQFDIIVEEKRKDNIASRSSAPKSKIAAFQARISKYTDASSADREAVRDLEKLYKEKKKTGTKASLIALENRINSKKRQIQATLRKIEQLSVDKKAMEEQIAEIEREEERRFHDALPKIQDEIETRISGWLVETIYRARILVNGSKEHHGDVVWSSYTGLGTWGRCSACSVALEDGSACACGNLMCHSHLAYCKQCLEPACSDHRLRCDTCNSIFCAGHSLRCEICKAGACYTHGGVCSQCSRKVCSATCSKRKGLFKKEMTCVDCSARSS